MIETVDARGLSCPQPVLDTLAKIVAMGSGKIEVLLDTEASKENVARAAQSKGWRVESVEEDNGEYRLMLAGD
ncbi:TusA-related sulfurtransferase [Paucidesulfovibrio gracilis DSM 16080]|uniref:TusA-related sulfurtransferase n=1 Tax=Paucidesulfovibrio gracilis DSM 16080 TaxID=1121449 RepID=A0A1T4XW58_9BACT|nr:sulfurtransferase TusA family protein [Paucidesulfovibrio gracilis]SKA93799.1 TusA-related sulfurtransferase [Paucidesulfovibrio gracilis DSM 16080]